MLIERLESQLDRLEHQRLRRTLRPLPAGVIDLSSNDYLGLAQHPQVVAAACEAVQRFGCGARASRLVSGQLELHQQLEAALAELKGCETALLFPSGYQANLAAIAALAPQHATVLCDKRNHASLIDGCRMAAPRQVRYYGSPEKLERLLRGAAAPALIISDTVYSMDGDLADVPELMGLAADHGATLLLDDAHGMGALGARGSGALEHFGLSGNGVVQTGTLSKALGSQGGFVAGPRVVVDWFVNTARPFIYSTGLNPASCGAALAALEVMRRSPHRMERLRSVKVRMVEGLRSQGYEVPLHPAPIIPLHLGSAHDALEVSNRLLEAGVWCPAIRPPTVPRGTSRLRITACSELSDEVIDVALAAFRSGIDRLK